MKNDAGYMAVIYLTLTLALIGGLVGLNIGWEKASREIRGESVQWAKVALPGGAKADHFVQGTGPAIFALTSDGALVSTSAPSFSYWYLVASIEEGSARGDLITGSCGNKDMSMGSLITQPPGVVKEQVDCSYKIPPEAGGYARFVLLEDGTIWRWSDDQETHPLVLVPATYLKYLCLYGLGISGGTLLLGLVLALIVRSSRGVSGEIRPKQSVQQNWDGFAGSALSTPAKAARWYFWLLAVLYCVRGVISYESISLMAKELSILVVLMAGGVLFKVAVSVWLGWGIGSRVQGYYYVAVIYLVWVVISGVININTAKIIDWVILIGHMGLLVLLLVTFGVYKRQK